MMVKLKQSLYNGILLTIEWIKRTVNIIGFTKNILYNYINHFYNLREANIQLGLTHLKNGYIKDARLRFYITDKIIAPKDPENLFYLGLTEFLLGNYDKCLNYIKENEFDTIGLYKYLSDTNIDEIPCEISDFYNQIVSDFKDKRYFNKKNQTNAIDDSLLVINNYLKSQHYNDNKIKVLDLASPASIYFNIAKFYGQNVEIETLDFDQASLEEKNIINNDLKYTSILHLTTLPLLSENIADKKYDLIIAFDSLSTCLNIEKYLLILKNSLNEGGQLILTIPKGAINKLIPMMNHFTYERGYVEKQLYLANLEIKIINSSQAKINSNYLTMALV